MIDEGGGDGNTSLFFLFLTRTRVPGSMFFPF